MKTLTEKEQLIKKLLENKSITFEEGLLLLEKEVQLQPYPISYPIMNPVPNYPTWWTGPITISSISA